MIKNNFFLFLYCVFFAGCFAVKKTEKSISKYALNDYLELNLIPEVKFDTVKSDSIHIIKKAFFSYEIQNHSYKPVVFNALAVSWNYTYDGQKNDSTFFKIVKEFYGTYYRGLNTNECGEDYMVYPLPMITKSDSINHLIIIPPRASVTRLLVMYACTGENEEKMYNPPFLQYIYKGEPEYKLQLIYDNLFYKTPKDSVWRGKLESNLVDF